jgi:hypothetical protein
VDLEPDFEQIWEMKFTEWGGAPSAKDLAALTRAMFKTLASRHDLLVHELVQSGINVSE